MSNIPRARETIADVAAELLAAGHEDWAYRLQATLEDLWRRRSSRPRAPRQSAPVTPEMAAFLRRFARRHPELSQQAIAERFGVNHGRVAEALLGDR